MSSRTLDYAFEYLARGWSVVPAPPRSKNPGDAVGKGWQKLRLVRDDLPKFFNNGNNIGLILGNPSGGLVDVDCDWKEPVFLAPRFLPPTGMISGRDSSPRSHYWFTALNVKTKQFVDPTDSDERSMIVELRSTGAQTLVAPSVHPSGECYIWHEFNDPASITPEQLQDAVARLAACSLLARHWRHGSRHKISLAVAGGLLRAGWNLEQVKAFISNAAEAADDEELQDRLIAVESTHERLRANQSTTGIPTLKELVDPRIVSLLSKWLRLRPNAFSEGARDKSAGRTGTKVPSIFNVLDSGVYTIDPTGEKEETFICSKLVIAAATRNKDGEAWGRLLEFEDLDGVPHSWAMPMEMLSSEGSEYRAHLLSMGLTIAPNRKARELLTTYIQTAKPNERARCVDRIGWYEGVFVLPDETFGNTGNERVIFQSTANQHSLRVSGSVEDWRENIARRCHGNSRLVFAGSCAFAGPLLPMTGEGGGGFHLRGLSSMGKTTGQRVAGSVWGGDSTNKGYLEPWRTTINGLEAVAEIHNDGLLCLDEIEQCDPHMVGEIAYMLANGIGKSRMTRNINARKKLTWNLIFLSSGERSLSDLALSVGKKTRGGQEVRMCDLEADAGKGLGMFECLHEFSSPAEFAGYLSSATCKYYGSPIRAYLRQLVASYDEASNAVKNFMKMFTASYVPKDSSGEVARVAIRFAIVAAAGELAHEITGWPEGEAMEAAATMFNVWLAGRGTKGSSDVEQAIRQVKGFLEAHGSSRFQVEGQEDARVMNRVGFKKTDEDGKTRYLILTESFRKEVCAGYDPLIVARELANRGYLIPGDGRNLARHETIEGFNRPRVYVLTSALLEE